MAYKTPKQIEVDQRIENLSKLIARDTCKAQGRVDVADQEKEVKSMLTNLCKTYQVAYGVVDY